MSTGKSSVDLSTFRQVGRPESITVIQNRVNCFSVQEAEESEESPCLASSPLRPMMHKLVPYKPPRPQAQKLRKPNSNEMNVNTRGGGGATTNQFMTKNWRDQQ